MNIKIGIIIGAVLVHIILGVALKKKVSSDADLLRIGSM